MSQAVQDAGTTMHEMPAAGDRDWQAAIQLATTGRQAEAWALVEALLARSPDSADVHYAAGICRFHMGRPAEAHECFRRALAADPGHIAARIYLALSVRNDGTHRAAAERRDILLNLMAQHPELGTTHPLSDVILRVAGGCCRVVGPMAEAVRLWTILAERSGAADDYYQLSECLATTDRLAEAKAALQRAIAIDPGKYATPAHLHSLHLIESARGDTGQGGAGRHATVRKGRYPETEVFRGDLRRLICEHIAVEHRTSPKIISPQTRFFTMGSCFARNITRALIRNGYDATHMEISEYINTTFANRYFVDWLEDALPDPAIRERIEELLPAGFSRALILERIRRTEVFILTLGVAPAFFDRETGAFIMPRPSSLNQRALGEKFAFRTTTVEENVANAIYLLSFVRKLSPGVKFVITVSPVPLAMTFECESAVVADCLSKSTMRLTAHQLVHSSGIKDIYYWPSFEIFRWAGCHTGPFFGTDDGAAWHVSEAAVDTTIASFIALFSQEG